MNNIKRINFKNIIDNNKFKIIIVTIFAFSSSLLSLYLMIGIINSIYKFITIIGTFIISFWYFYKNYKDIIKLIFNNKKYATILFIASIMIFYEFTHQDNMNDVMMRFFNLKGFYYISFLGLLLVINLVGIYIKDWLLNFIKNMDFFEKKSYIIISVIVFLALFILYSNKVNFYHDYNVVYSIDSGDVYDKYFSNAHYYELRHPLTSVLTFPVFAIVKFIFNENLQPVILQFINIQLLILVGFELKRLTNNKWVFIFYMSSFTSILFMLFFEKYILSTFLLVTYLYNIFINKKDGYKTLIFSIGTLPTNIFIGIMEFFKKISITYKMQNINKIIFLVVITIIVTGRISFISTFISDLGMNRDMFGPKDYTIIEKFNSTTKMIEQSLIALPSAEKTLISLAGVEYKAYFWKDITGNVSYVALLILAIILLGVKDIFIKKKTIYYSFLLGLAFSFVLFMFFAWDIPESPLFTLCFSWAIIPLFIYGCEKLFIFF